MGGTEHAPERGPASAADLSTAHVSTSAHAPTHKTPPGAGNAHQKDRGAAHQVRQSAKHAQKAATHRAQKAAQHAAHTTQQVAPRVQKTVQHVAQRAQRVAQKAQARPLVAAVNKAPNSAPGDHADGHRMRHDAFAHHAAPRSRHSDSPHRWQERHPSAYVHAASTHLHRSTASAPTPAHTAAPVAVTVTTQTEQQAQEPEDADADVAPVPPFPESAAGGETWSMTSSQATGGSAPSIAMIVTSASGSADPDGGLLGSRAPTDDDVPSGPADSAESFPD
ncbi:hypothetical protein GCM10025863_26210 [Microbacterium suwonense]|uniref:Uncharacterized protein n=1 Tax=Microbacterium suwonense TaxID=683047 RepID=A0ABN6X7L8_9MICO|nr:hypothetical protein GCM10025863_26210 [Microbacterium suwonense]